MKVYLSILFILFTFASCDNVNPTPVGCFKYSSVITNYVSHDADVADPKCIRVCATNYYK